MKSGHLPLLAIGLAMAAAGCASHAAQPAAPPATSRWPIRHEARSGAWADGAPWQAQLAWVDLRDPRISFHVPAPPAPGAPRGAEARLQALDAWAQSDRLDLAVNANFFARLPGAAEPLLGWSEGEWVDLVGLSVAEGVVVSPPRKKADGAGLDPALLVRESAGGHCPCDASVAFPAAADLAGVSEAVAGYGPNERLQGTRLVEAGENRGATARVQWNKRHPRTAVGVSRDGSSLVLVVVDGRREGWSAGATLPELAQVLIDAGAWDAVALDGGGSSALWLRGETEKAGAIRSRPSDGRVRAVGNGLGVRVQRAP
ncbi:MAG: phosphodiester glycosidase family protein [Vicinamibacteria bacterium]|nr:phosphodiester glycosidase family protein [Vicinamibacteria bacterium]